MSNEVNVVETEVLSEMKVDAMFDIQVVTAKRFPRNEKDVENKIVRMISSDKDFAIKCRYSKPVAGKQVNGISVHLARVMAKEYKNMRVEARLVRIEEKIVVCEAIAFDLENNYAVKQECIRSIYSVKNKTRYSEDTINTTIAAARAIAFRDAVNDIIPNYIKSKCERTAIEVITGDLSDETKLNKSRAEWLAFFNKTYGTNEFETLSLVGCSNVNQLNSGKIADLSGVHTAIKSGEFDLKAHVEGLKKQTTTGQQAAADKMAEIIGKESENGK